MAVCLVLQNYLGWKKNDHVEIFDKYQLQKLVMGGIVAVLEEDTPVIPLARLRDEKGRYLKGVKHT